MDCGVIRKVNSDCQKWRTWGRTAFSYSEGNSGSAYIIQIPFSYILIFLETAKIWKEIKSFQ